MASQRRAAGTSTSAGPARCRLLERGMLCRGTAAVVAGESRSEIGHSSILAPGRPSSRFEPRAAPSDERCVRFTRGGLLTAVLRHAARRTASRAARSCLPSRCASRHGLRAGVVAGAPDHAPARVVEQRGERMCATPDATASCSQSGTLCFGRVRHDRPRAAAARGAPCRSFVDVLALGAVGLGEAPAQSRRASPRISMIRQGRSAAVVGDLAGRSTSAATARRGWVPHPSPSNVERRASIASETEATATRLGSNVSEIEFMQ